MSNELPETLNACHRELSGQRSRKPGHPVSLWAWGLLLHHLPLSHCGLSPGDVEWGSLTRCPCTAHLPVILCFTDFMGNRYSVSTHFVHIILRSPLNSEIIPDSPRFCIPANYTPILALCFRPGALDPSD